MSRLVFITGASSGIGQALALRFFQQGYALALTARRDEQLQAWAQACGIGQDRCRIYAADVAQPASIIAAARSCLEQQGVPDIVVANAGISIGMDTCERDDIDVMAQVFATNNIGMAATFHAFIAPMQRRGTGILVGIGSVAGIRGLPGHAAYCASKAAVINYCESLRGELRSQGIKVVTLCPGYVDTPLTQKNRYAMPFLMAPHEFAEKAMHAIESGASYRVIPWQMGVVAKLLRILPNSVFDRVLSGRPRKDRKPQAAHRE